MWAPAWIRLEKKVLALKERVSLEKRRTESRGDLPRDLRHWTKIVEPLGAFDQHGNFEWEKDTVEKIKSYGKPEKVSAAQPRGRKGRA